MCFSSYGYNDSEPVILAQLEMLSCSPFNACHGIVTFGQQYILQETQVFLKTWGLENSWLQHQNHRKMPVET
jgi:hypothetical protein